MPFTKMVHCQDCNKVLQYIHYPAGLAILTGEEFLYRCPHCKQTDLIWLRIVNGMVTSENDPFLPENRLQQYEEERQKRYQ